MSSAAPVVLVLVLCALGANLPFVNERLFAVGTLKSPKSVAWRLLELVVYLGVVIAVGTALEARAGTVQAQGWQFYAVMLCVFLTLAFPGFVWRYLRRQRHVAAPVDPDAHA